MGFSLQYPRSNQRLFSFKSTLLLDGAEVFKGLTKVSVKAEVDGREVVFSNGVIGVGRPRGQLKVEFSMTYLADSFFSWAKANPQFMDMEFDLSFIHEEGASRHTIEILKLVFDSFDLSPEGTDATEVEVPGTPLNLLIDGKPLMFGDTLGQIGLGGI